MDLEENSMDEVETQDQIQAANEIVQTALKVMIDANIDPLVTAAVFATTGLSIYKVSLNDLEYHTMVDNISDTRDSIMPVMSAPKQEIIH